MSFPQPTAGVGHRWISPGRVVWGVVILLALLFFYVNRGEWDDIADAAREAQPIFLLLAAMAQAAWMVAFGAEFWAGFSITGVRFPFRRALVLAWACNFINMVVKSGGMGGMAVFIRDGGRRGYAGSRVTVGYLLVIALSYGVFLLVLGVALALLFLQGEARRTEVASATGVFFVIVAALAVVLWVLRTPARVRASYGGLARVVNALARRLRRGPWIDPEGGETAAREVAEAQSLLRDRPARLLAPTGVLLLKELVAVGVLYSVLEAFDATPSLSLAVIAYALTVLFSFVSIVPSGLGLVEVSLTALLVREGVPAGAALLTTAVYRLFQVWVPFLIGAAASRFVGSTPRESAPT